MRSGCSSLASGGRGLASGLLRKCVTMSGRRRRGPFGIGMLLGSGLRRIRETVIASSSSAAGEEEDEEEEDDRS